MVNSSSSGWLARTNASPPARTIRRRAIIELLLSRISPTATGMSALVKNVICWGVSSSKTRKTCCGRFGTASDRSSNTLT